MTELEKLRNHQYYNCDTEEMRGHCERVKDLCFAYNRLEPSARAEREALLRQIFAGVGESPWIEAPFQGDVGIATYLGDRVYINHNCVMLDSGGVTIGNDVRIGPNCGIYTPEHAYDPFLRAAGYERAYPIVIGDNVWIGGGVSILGGVTIGKNSIIGAGSVVTRDIPANVIAAGNPCRVLRELTEEVIRSHSPNLE